MKTDKTVVDTDLPPGAAIEKALRLMGCRYATLEAVRAGPAYYTQIIAFARYIADKEPDLCVPAELKAIEVAVS